MYERVLKTDGHHGEHWARFIMNKKVAELINSLPIDRIDVLEISGTNWKDLNFKSYDSVQFPDFDICESKTDRKYDLIIAEQVFEHLAYPYRAAKNIASNLKPKGRILITTPFLIKIHKCPIDCTRWTETGMQYFLEAIS
jgi:2-polyprenyl-3-methyl-5-hydroxy-6-metoxy-1,4-benzoquinol methylase